MTIRPYRNADRAALIALWREAGLIRPWNDPEADIALAQRSDAATILVADAADGADGALSGAVMTGFDGHRGWLYYLATDPDRRGEGLGRALTDAAEVWLAERGCPKVEAVLRAENTAVHGFYEAIGYRREPRALFSKWLVEPPAPQVEEAPAPETVPEDADVPTLDVTITWLEMTAPPRRPPVPMPACEKPVNLIRLIDPPVDYYRFVQHTIGDPWLWWTRRALSNEQLAEIIKDEDVEIYILQLGGAPAGMIELDFRAMPETATISYLGLMPWCIGQGLGPYLLDWGIRCAWEREPAPRRLTLDTCSLDHPKALAGYQKAGFRVYDRTTRADPDPRARDLIPPTVDVQSDAPPWPR